MNRHARMILLMAIGPAIATAVFISVAFGALYLAGFRYSREQIEAGAIVYFACWQIIAIWWLWKNW